MRRTSAVGISALLAVAGLGCGNSSELREPTIARALVRLSFPERVVAVPSSDPQFAMEASVPMVASESAGVNAYIYSMGVEATDEASGSTIRVPFVRGNSIGTVPARSSVEIPFRVYLPAIATYRIKVSMDTYDDGQPPGTGNSGSLVLWDNPRSSDRTLVTGEFRLLPPQ